MDLSNLKPAEGSVKKDTRFGRGQGSGKGGTSTKGHKGAQSRSGYKRRAGFEGGQMPLQRRVPKRGFKNYNRVEYRVFNLDHLQELLDKYKWDKVDFETLRAHKLIQKNDKVKILGRGELKSKIEISVHAVSATAKSAIESLGGTVNIIE
jgi:large subunit ribosomal protein L15